MVLCCCFFQVIQKLVFPFSRMSYRPANETQFFSKLEMVLEMKALSSPLATVNILMSLFQLGHFPSLVLHRVFSPSFISNVTSESVPLQISASVCQIELVLYHVNEFQIVYVFYLILILSHITVSASRKIRISGKIHFLL